MSRLMDAWNEPGINDKTINESSIDKKKTTRSRGRKKISRTVKPVTLMLYEDDIQYCSMRAKSAAKENPEINSASAFIRMLIDEDRTAHPKLAAKAREIIALYQSEIDD